jgi:hypothetical protein
VLVYDFCGPSFQHDALARFNQDTPSSLGGQSTSIIAQGMCQVLNNIPEVAQNPALRRKEAIKDLLRDLQPVVLQWAVRQCEDFESVGGRADGSEGLSAVKEQLVRYRQLLGPEDAALERTTSKDEAARAESSPAGERTRPHSAAEPVHARRADWSPSPPVLSPEQIKARPVKRSHPSSAGSKSLRDLTGALRETLASPQAAPARQLTGRTPSISDRGPERFPGPYGKLKSEGRGWRSRPGVHSGHGASLS